MKYTGRDAVKEVEKRFISKKHLQGLEQVMKECRLVAAFRAAGAYTLEKLEHGAAAKPHSVLDKSIKPEELGLLGGFPELSLAYADKNLVQEEPLRTAKRFLCGLVGHRNEQGELRGVYLSQEGQAVFREMGQEPVFNKKGAAYIQFANTDELLQCVGRVLAQAKLPLSASSCFVTGDYDLHEIQVLKEGQLTHVEADSQEEAFYLQLLSLGSLGQYVEGEAYFPEFVPCEHSPIQHGAQDNYLRHMFLSERKEELVPKVLIPDPDLAVFCGTGEGTGGWTVFDNRVDSNRNYHELLAILAQVEDLKEYYQGIHGELPEHWKLYDWRIQDEVMGYFNLTPEAYEEMKGV